MDLGKNIFSANNHWSTEVIIITIGVLIVTLGVMYAVFFVTHLSIIIKIFLLLPLIVILLYFGCTTPVKLELDAKKIAIVKAFGSIKIPREEVVNIYKISPKSLSKSIRLFGSGGFFGYLGKFENSIIGKYQMYITEKKNLILIETSSMKYVVNCKHEEEFINLLK